MTKQIITYSLLLLVASIGISVLTIEPQEVFAGNGTGYKLVPTMGIDPYFGFGDRKVTNGFSCNGQSVNVDTYYTPFPKLTLNTGESLHCEFKAYSELGAKTINHIEFGIGKKLGQSMSDRDGTVIYHYGEVSHDKTFKDVTFEKTIIKENGRDIAKFTLDATITEPTRDDIVIGVWIWAESLYNGFDTIVHFFNEGIEVTGQSLNPTEPIKEVKVSYGNKSYPSDPANNPVNTRLAADFDERKQFEELKAKAILEAMF